MKDKIQEWREIMSFPTDLRHFTREEFRHPDAMDTAFFVGWTECVRKRVSQWSSRRRSAFGRDAGRGE